MDNLRFNLFSQGQIEAVQDFGRNLKMRAEEFTEEAAQAVKEGVSQLEQRMENSDPSSIISRLQWAAPDDRNRVRQAVGEVLPLSAQDLFCFDALVKEYLTFNERYEFEQKLKNIEKESAQAPDREAFVRKALSNIRLDQAIEQWGKRLIQKAHGEFFIKHVRDGRRDFHITREVPQGISSTDLMRFNISCDSVKKRLQLNNRLYLEKVVKEMKDQFPEEIVQAVADDLDPDITLGNQMVKREEFRGECKSRHDEVLEAKEVDKLFKGQMINELSEVYSTVLQSVNQKNSKKFNLALSKALIEWVSKNVDQNQVSEILARAFAHMGPSVGEGITASAALRVAEKHQKVLAKADPFEAFKQAIFPEGAQIETFEMD